MNLTITLETRYCRTPDQKIWTDGIADYLFWHRYLNIFESVDVIARVRDVASVPLKHKRADGKGVKFIALPCYIGPAAYLKNSLKIQRIVKLRIKDAEAVILRTPGQISNCVFRELKKNRHPYGVEVVADPYDVFAPGAVDHPLRFFFRRWSTKQLQEQCRYAVAASYVTKMTLQKRYPNTCYSTHYSSIDIRKEAYVTSPRIEFGKDGIFRIVLVGSLAQLYKSPDILINAVALCSSKGHKIKLKFIGDGKFRSQLEEQVARLGLNDSIKFLGQLPAGDAVRNELLHADLFILPSRTEGLPRAMIEAMACGLPCIGSNVGGIPELLPKEYLVPPGNEKALAYKIEEIITNPERMRAMSIQNLMKSVEYRNDILDQRRNEFYKYLRNKTEILLKNSRFD